MSVRQYTGLLVLFLNFHFSLFKKILVMESRQSEENFQCSLTPQTLASPSDVLSSPSFSATASSYGKTFQELRDQMSHLQQRIEQDSHHVTSISSLTKTSSPSCVAMSQLTKSQQSLPVPEMPSATSSVVTGVKDYAVLTLEWQQINQNLSMTRQGLKVIFVLVL